MKARTFGLFATTALLLGAGLAMAQDTQPMEGHEGHAQAAPVDRAIAVMHATEGNAVAGTVTFERVDDGIRITANLTGLTPGNHGFHVHQFGDCSAPDATSAGGHFNPGNADHGSPEGAPRHAGDFGNIEADEAGNATYDRVDTLIAFDGANSVLGRGLIVHADPDDMTTQPTGAAGARVACGVIGVAGPENAE